MTVTEAAACGTPAVVTDIAGHRDAVQSTASRACCRPTCAALARDISRLLGDRDDARAACGPRASHARASSRGKRPPPAPSPRWPAKRGGRPEARADGDRDRIERVADLAGVAARSTWASPSSRTSRCSSPTAARSSADTKTYLYLDPEPPAREGALPVGLRHRPRHGHPPDHRLPVPDGAVLLADGARSGCPTGSRSASGSARSCSPPARACCSSCARWAGAPPSRCARAGWSSPLRPTCSPPTSSTTRPASR